MDSKRWARIEEVFQQALDLPEARRSAWLEAECGDDIELHGEVISLLSHAAVAHTGLEQAMGIVVDEIESSVAGGPKDDVGTRVGPFHLVKEIGRGGMGTVYLGFRATDEFRQSVAVKLVSRGMDSRAILGRFRNERRILAALEHPNIARLFDGGSTPDGRPYFVMEHVDGLTVTEYCRTRTPDIQMRLRIFLDICSAVEHAHRRMVIHRDIKPGNILVLPDGTPKLLDFGIAKILDDPDSAEGALTGTQTRLLTPEYASPEQVLGEPVSAATDVYALGAVLFEMLTGSKAHEVSSRSQAELERAICTEATQLPSAALARSRDAAAARSAREVRGDLDNIVLMAMRKEPARRYQSVADLAADIERYLAGRPVVARQDTFLYRASKFVRRNRVGVAAAVVVLLTLAAGVASTVYEARRAERRFAQVRKLANKFLFDFDGEISKVPGTTKAREMLVRTALEYLDSLSSEASGDISLQAELAAAYQSVGDIQGRMGGPNLGQHQAATVSYRKAIQVEERVLAARPGDADAQYALATSWLRLARVQYYLFQFPQLEASLAKARPIAEALAAGAGNNARYFEPVLSANDMLGTLQMAREEHSQALATFRSNVEYQRKVLALRAPGSTAAVSSSIELGRALVRVGVASVRNGELGAARTAYMDADKLLGELAAKYPANFQVSKDRLNLYSYLGLLDQNYPAQLSDARADARAAVASFTKATDLARARFEADPRNSDARYDYANSCLSTAANLALLDPKAAQAIYRNVPSLGEGMSHELMTWKLFPYRTEFTLALLAAGGGDLASARAHMEAAIATMEKVLAATPDLAPNEVILSRVRLSDWYEKADPAMALRLLEAARKRAEAISTEYFTGRALQAGTYGALGRHYALAGDRPTAALWYQRQKTHWAEWLRNHPAQDYITSEIRKADEALNALSAGR